MISNHVKELEGRHEYVRLDYSIVATSSHSANYVGDNIKFDRPSDQSSRWSSLVNDQNQFVLVQLPEICLIRTLTFGKFHKVHVCNLKEFRVEAGLSADALKPILYSGLRNDSEPETFTIENCLAQWVKIIPMMPWGGSFNYSIWYFEMRGFAGTHPKTQDAIGAYLSQSEHESWRSALRLLRHSGMEATAVDILKSKPFIEPPLVSKLFELILQRGDFKAAEDAIVRADPDLSRYLDQAVPYEGRWARLDGLLLDTNGSSSSGLLLAEKPCARGGHQMVLDPHASRLYLFGGWEGQRDLSDLWTYDIAQKHWSCLSRACEKEGGPSPRSCHKMVIDASRRVLLVLGRYVDPESRAEADPKSELFAFNLEDHSWSVLCGDTFAAGGPPLVYDHQMTMDEERGVLYVFGGRGIASKADNSGLFSYDLGTAQWSVLRTDEKFASCSPHFKSRIGHSMVWDAHERALVIFAGQRNKDYLCDLYVYHVDTDTVSYYVKETNREGGPDAGFTQRASVDPHAREMFLFSGLYKDANASKPDFKGSSIWSWHLDRHAWSRVRCAGPEPAPRYAHQICHDPQSQSYFMFGGNPGNAAGSDRRRLDDFWQLHLRKERSADDILRQLFREMCLAKRGSRNEVMSFLQTQLAEVVDHSKAEESAAFRALSTWLFNPPPAASTDLSLRSHDPVTGSRLALFNEIASIVLH